MVKRSEKVALHCLQQMLRPLAQYCVRHSLTIQEFLEAAKTELLNAATNSMQASSEKVNISRLSVMTGIHRRDVMRITREGPALSKQVSLISRVLAQWEQDPEFQGAGGKPKLLTAEGDENEFKRLVEKVSQDLNAGTILFQLERVGAVERSKAGVKLKRAAVSLRGDLAQGYQLLGRDVEDLIAAVHENLEGQLETPHLHARTEYDNLYVDKLPDIEAWVLEEGSKFHERLRNFLSKYDRDVNPKAGGPAGARIVVGTFSRTETRSKKDDLEQAQE